MSAAPSIFAPAEPLPHGPHGLSRAQVAASQRERLMSALTELLAEGGYAAVTIRELAGRAGVSRAAFYDHFADKDSCLFAAYDRFATVLLDAMSAGVDDSTPWSAFIDTTLEGYLGTLEANPGAARAFVVEMDAAGPAARRRRREAVHGFAALLAQRHAAIRARDPSLGPLPERVYLGLALGVRELVREALEDDPAPSLRELAPDIVDWLTATVEGASKAA
jgi:AcrR family transcriptional regulator